MNNATPASNAMVRARQGVALVIVLLILAIATVAVVAMSSSRQLDIRRTENTLRAAEAYDYLYSLESWAAVLLKTAAAEQPIAAALPSTAIAGGAMTARLADLQGRFNLNNLLVDNQPSEVDIQRFQRLLALLDIKPQIVAALLDWQDADSDIRYPDGGEDETYLQQQPPYRCANRPLADVRELLAIRGIGRDDYQKLKPYVYVTHRYAPMNVNTADPLLLLSLADGLNAKNIDLLARAIRRKPFATLTEFLQHDAIAALAINKQALTTVSDEFLLTTDINIGSIALQFESQLQRRPDGSVALLARRRRSPEHG